MPPLFIAVSTAFLVAVFAAVCIGAWRIHRSQVKLPPLAERAMLAVIFAIVGLQALTYLRADHPQASDARVLAVWIQLVTGFGIAVVAIMSRWLVIRSAPRSSPM
jgi:hypothetical protein